jgi:hypothetical protein
MRLSRRAEPFDSDHFIYELKIDGFRARAYSQNSLLRFFSTFLSDNPDTPA